VLLAFRAPARGGMSSGGADLEQAHHVPLGMVEWLDAGANTAAQTSAQAQFVILSI
jgi:hypothetical protein